jgi:2-polyprenylphenol 6-hydroxylase
MSGDYDLAIIGGGPVGAVLGSLLRRGPGRQPPRVLLLERKLADPLPPGEDARVFALSRASERILQSAGAWFALMDSPRVVTPYQRMHVWPATAAPRGEGSLTFDALELGEANLGCIVANSALQQAACDAFEAAGGELLQAEVKTLDFHSRGMALELATAAGPQTVHAKLVVGADGAGSMARRAAGLALEAQDYQQWAVVANLHTERGHEATAWQRFLGEGTLALLPLTDLAGGDRLVSLVWSLPRARAERLLTLTPAEFAQELTAASGGILGELRLATERRSFPLRRAMSEDYVRERIALVGDAAHIIHPLAGQGANLGLLDAATLAEVVLEAWAQGEDPGAERVLRRYQRWRQGENVAMALAMEAFNRLLAFGGDVWGQLAERGMGWVGRSPPLRQSFARRALGLSGRMPQAARVNRDDQSWLRR